MDAGEGDRELDDLASELRRRVGPEWRADAEAAEREAARAARRRRSVADVARIHMARGDEVVLALPGRRFAGAVRAAAGDLVALDTPTGRVDVRVTGPVTLTVTRASAGAGREPRAGAGSFLARLRELEMEARPVRLGLSGHAEELSGRLAVAADDHVVLDTGEGEVVVALAGLLWVAERPAPGRR